MFTVVVALGVDPFKDSLTICKICDKMSIKASSNSQVQKYLKTHNKLLNTQGLYINSIAETSACILTVLAALAIDCLVTLNSWPESGGLTPTVAELINFYS